MKSYDDLQRFKEKTQTNHIEFKDMSEQVLNSDTTHWAVIKQLLNDGAGSVLDNGQLIARVVPQPIKPAAFTSSPSETAAVASSLPVQSYVPATPAASDRVGASLLDSISASLQPVAAPVERVAAAPVQAPVADAAPLRAMPVAQQTAVSASSLLAQVAAKTSAVPVPASAPVHQATDPGVIPSPLPAVDAPVQVSYKQLFSTAAEPASAALPKDMLLHSLLEKIASCR